MTWSYLSPLPHTSCIPYEEACSLTTRQYSHMLLALKEKPTTSSVKISFYLFTLHDLFLLVSVCQYILWIYLCYILPEFIKTKHYSPCLYDSKHSELIFICYNELNHPMTHRYLCFWFTAGEVINYQVHDDNNKFGCNFCLFISWKCDKMQTNTHIIIFLMLVIISKLPRCKTINVYNSSSFHFKLFTCIHTA